MQEGPSPPSGLSREPTLVVYDDLGAGEGDTIGFVEGREAAMPFPKRTPIDAIDAAIVDDVNHRPLP
jgi:microcompartment protein CcmK/EutM